MLGLPGALLPSAELTSQVLPKTPKIPTTKDHAEVEKNIMFGKKDNIAVSKIYFKILSLS